MEQKGRILGDAANLESACKEDITATLRHHESLLKSMNAGAPAAARDAIASRIEIVQAIYAKEPFHVQLVKVQAALARAEEVAEKKHSAVWTAREAADKADQHVLDLRQRMAELTDRIYTDTDTGMNEEPWSCGEWQHAGGSWSGWQWDVQARAVGERTALGMEVENLRGAVLGLQQEQVDVQAGMAALIGELRGMAAAVGFAAGGCASDACGEKSMKAESWTNVESVGAGDTERDLQMGCRAKSGASCCKVPTNRGQRGRVDRWRRGRGTVAANAAAPAGVAWDNSRLSVQWMNVRGESNSREVILPSFSSVEPGVVKAPDFACGLAGCAELRGDSESVE